MNRGKASTENTERSAADAKNFFTLIHLITFDGLIIP